MKQKKAVIAVVIALVLVAIVVAVILINTKTKLTVSFSINGEIVETQKIEEGKNATKPYDPETSGMEFLGWYLGDKKFDFSTPIKKNINLEAKWQKKVEEPNQEKHTITLNIDGKLFTIETDENGKVEEPEEPSKSGYEFLGWYIGDEKVDFSKEFTENTTIVAKWEEKVEEDNKNNESNNSSNSLTNNSNNNSTNNSNNNNQTTTQTKKYTVTFNSDGGSTVAKQTIEENKLAKQPSNPTKSGYVFKGWYLNGTKFDFSTKITKNITLIANWEKEDVITYEVKKIENSVAGQAKLYILLNGERVAGTADFTKDGKTTTVSIPSTGLDKPEDFFNQVTISNIKAN